MVSATICALLVHVLLIHPRDEVFAASLVNIKRQREIDIFGRRVLNIIYLMYDTVLSFNVLYYIV